MITSFAAAYRRRPLWRNAFPAAVLFLGLCAGASAEPLIKGVEREADRGRGRVVDRPTYELNRIERSQQSPPPREIDVILEEEDRRRMIERRQRTDEERSILDERRDRMAPLEPDVDPVRTELVSLILAAVERRDLQLARARRTLPPAQLPDREAEINRQFSEELRFQLDRWRSNAAVAAPATQPGG